MLSHVFHSFPQPLKRIGLHFDVMAQSGTNHDPPSQPDSIGQAGVVPGTRTKRLLIAVRPEDLPTLGLVLGTEFDTVVCTSLTEAQAKLDDSIGLIACGVHFDDGRMFDLLRNVKANPQTASIPFFGLMGSGRELSSAILEGIESAAKALGASGLIDLAKLKHEFGEEQTHTMLRAEIRNLLK